ncbi:exodeoxyribonuclease III [Archangium sp.]|uniref:exodeoxyribonuclease III n=1 Tax=Archangium sp. TaxID=1872627 RepID=UPI00389AFE94
MRIVSWNVNGLRSAHKKGFLDWLAAEKADVVGVQEVRAREEQLPEEVRTPEGWRATHFVAAERPGYSGVGLFARKAPDDVESLLGVKEMDCEGRLQVARFGRLTVVNCYFPNGNGKERDNSRVPFKLAFYRRLFKRLEKGFRDGERILVMGDFNTAHQEIDLARPRDNRETSGFRPEEREEFDRWIRAGWVDTFRHFEKGEGHYSWWSQRFGVRERNVGWRLDYVLASPGAMPYVKRAAIHPLILGSDHCPVSVDLDPKVRR